VLLRSGAAEGVVDAVVRVSDERPIKYSLTLDNTGTPQTGTYRVGLGYQHANLFKPRPRAVDAVRDRAE